MNEKIDREALENDIKRANFTRAAALAEGMGLPEQELRDLRCKALGQTSAIFRNAPGMKALALQYGFSKEEVKRILEEFREQLKEEGKHKSLEPCYDYRTGKYLSFEEWMDHYLKNWDRLSV